MDVVLQLLPLELLFIVGSAAILSLVFWATLWFLTRSYGTQEEKIVDAEFTPVRRQQPYKPGDNLDIET